MATGAKTIKKARQKLKRATHFATKLVKKKKNRGGHEREKKAKKVLQRQNVESVAGMLGGMSRRHSGRHIPRGRTTANIRGERGDHEKERKAAPSKP